MQSKTDKELSEEFKELIQICWQHDENLRPNSYWDILNHGFLQGEIASQEDIINRFSEEVKLNYPDPDETEEEKKEHVEQEFSSSGSDRGNDTLRIAPINYPG